MGIGGHLWPLAFVLEGSLGWWPYGNLCGVATWMAHLVIELLQAVLSSSLILFALLLSLQPTSKALDGSLSACHSPFESLDSPSHSTNNPGSLLARNRILH